MLLGLCMLSLWNLKLVGMGLRLLWRMEDAGCGCGPLLKGCNISTRPAFSCEKWDEVEEII